MNSIPRLAAVIAAGLLSAEPARSATLTVTTANNINPGAGEVSLVQALTAARDGDTIAFNLPGAGPHYLVTPAGGYPLVTAHNLVIDGYTQPGASPNTARILQPNEARLRIVLDSRNGAARVLDFDGYGLSESAILGIAGATNVTVRGLGFLARPGAGTEADPSLYCISFGRGASAGRVQGCWLGVDVDGRTVAGANAGVTGFRYRGETGTFLVDHTVVGVDPAATNPPAAFNVIAGMIIPVILEGSNIRIAGNFLGVLPSGTNEFRNAAAGYRGEGAIQIGRSEGHVVIGTDGDGANDPDERNVLAGVLPRTIEPETGYFHHIEFYGGGSRENIVVAGNYIGVGIDGQTRFTNGVPVVGGLTGTARIGSDLDGVSDAVEGNVIFNHHPSGLFTKETVVPEFLDGLALEAVVSLRGNRLVNNFAPPVSAVRDGGIFLYDYYAKAISDPESGVVPILTTNTTVSRLEGSIPAWNKDTFPTAAVDLYLVDPEGLATGKALGYEALPEGFIQGMTFLGTYIEGGPADLDPAPGAFRFNISALKLPVGAALTATASYAAGQIGSRNVPTLTTPFSVPIAAAAGQPDNEPPGPLQISLVADGVAITFTGVLQSASDVAGPWSDVPGATSPHTVAVSAGGPPSFYRARSR